MPAWTGWQTGRSIPILFCITFPSGHGAGGMEHAYGTAIDINARYLSGDMLPVASVSAHEFFHLWNVKRHAPAVA